MADRAGQRLQLGDGEDGPAWWPGKRVGRYSLVAKLARGGMAEIWLARQEGPQGFERVMVVKRILAGAEEPNFVQMLIDEARIAAQLSHPNIVQVFELGEQEGAYFIAMEYLHGENLSWIARAGLTASNPLPITHAVRIIASAAEGLAHAHTKKGLDGRPLGIVHRDISPQNIIVTFDGVVKLVDFGIAKAHNRSSKTADGRVKGKLAYMSPEQARGEPVDAQSDIFSLGVLLYEAVTRGRFLPEGDDRDIWALIAGEKPFLPARARSTEVPQSLDAIIARALARDKNQRFATARFFQVALEQWLKEQTLAPGSAELEEYMRAIFTQRIAQRARLLELARAGGVPPRTIDETGDTTLDSMPGHTQHTAVSRAVRALTQGLLRPRTIAGSAVFVLILAVIGYRVGWMGAKAIEPAPMATTLEIETVPAAARLTVDAQPAGVSPVALKTLGVGRHEVTATLDGFISARSSIEVRTVGETLRLAMTLTPEQRIQHESSVTFVTEPAPATPPTSPELARKPARPAVVSGRLSVDASPWAKVYLGNRLLGETPLLDLALPAGKHTLRLLNDEKHLEKRIEVEIKAGQQTIQRVKLDGP